MTKQTQKLFLMLIIGIFLGATAVNIFTRDSAGVELVPASTPSDVLDDGDSQIPPSAQEVSRAKDFPLPPSVPKNTRVGLSVLDQAAGKTVLVTEVSVENISWVAIYEDKSGQPGSILGASKVKVGETSTLVELLRPEGTLSGHKYYATVLEDNGDGEFSRLTDLPPFSPDKVVIVSFVAK